MSRCGCGKCGGGEVMAEPRIQYAKTSDGVRIAYAVER